MPGLRPCRVRNPDTTVPSSSRCSVSRRRQCQGRTTRRTRTFRPDMKRTWPTSPRRNGRPRQSAWDRPGADLPGRCGNWRPRKRVTRAAGAGPSPCSDRKWPATAQRQSNESALRELVGEVTARRLAQADSRFRIVEDHERRRERALSVRYKQISILRGESGSDFETDVMLRDVLAPFLRQLLDLRLFDRSRPCTHDFVPGL